MVSVTLSALALCAVMSVCVLVQLATGDPVEPEQDCEVWFEPPSDVPHAFRIGVGNKAVCQAATQPTVCSDEDNCPKSCNVVNSTMLPCWCDEGCDVYEDCCIDSPKDVCYRSGDPFPPGEIAGTGVTPARHEKEQCVRTSIYELGKDGAPNEPLPYSGHWLLAGCPAGYENHEIEARCNSPQQRLVGATESIENNTVQLVHAIPVAGLANGTWTHFKNMYCAFCHGVHLLDMVPWNLTNLDCYIKSFDANNPPHYFVYKKCEEYAYRFNPPAEIGNPGVLTKQPRPCLPGLIDKCPTGDGADAPASDAGSWAAELCESYSAAALRGNRQWYKNPHCLVCHGLLSNDSDPYPYCYKPGTLAGNSGSPIATPFNFLPLAEDAFQVALNLECPLGFNYSYEAEKCVPGGGVSDLFCDKALPVVKAQISVSVNETATQNETWVETLVSMLVDSLGLDQTVIRNISSEAQTDENPPASDDSLAEEDKQRVISFDISNMSTVWERFSNLSDEMAIFRDDAAKGLPGVTPLSVALYESCTGEASLDQCVAKSFNVTDVQFYVFGGITYMYQNDEPVLYQAENIIIQVVYTLRNHSSLGRGGVSRKFITCSVAKDLLCYHITLSSPTEYQIKDGVMEFSIGGTVYRAFEYLILPDGSAKICEDDMQDPWLAFSPPQYILNVVGTSLSSLALVLTFVTYAMFSSLRTVPGKATMHFVVALFAGEILLLIGGSVPRDATGACTFMAVISHYVWLACFFWMTALGFDVSRTFSIRTGPRLIEKGGHALLWMCVFSWGAPAMVLVVCIALHFAYSSSSFTTDSTPSHSPSASSQIDFNYGHNGVCWIRPELANLLAFGLPVMASLVVNGALFVKTIIGLRASKKITSFVEKDKSAMQRAGDEFLIYLKVSVLMGLTWIWFFIAAFTRVTAIFYIAIILNAFHGVFVFVAFICNRRVWNLWRRRLDGGRAASTASRSGTLSGKSGDSTGACMTKSSSMVTSDGSLTGSPIPERIGLNGTRL